MSFFFHHLGFLACFTLISFAHICHGAHAKPPTESTNQAAPAPTVTSSIRLGDFCCFPGLKFERYTLQPQQAAVEVAIWYPTMRPASVQKVSMGRDIRAAYNGPITAGSKPLIILSGESGMHNLSLERYARDLASRGFIAVQLNHPGDHALDISNSKRNEKYLLRPPHITQLLNLLLASEWKTAIDDKHIGIVGYGVGGATALALIGAPINLNDLLRHCNNYSAADATFCGENNSPGFFNTFTLWTKRLFNSGKTYTLSDSRIKAAVLIAPAAALFTPNALSNINVPTRLYLAENDNVLNPNYHGEYAAQRIPGTIKKNLAGITHYTFTAYIDPVLPQAQEVNADGGTIKRETLQKLVADDFIPFLATEFRR